MRAIPAAPSIGSLAVGTLGVTAVFSLFQYLKMRPPAAKNQKEQESRTEEPALPEIKIVPQELSYICVNTTDLEEITQLLTQLRKRYHVL